MHHAITQYLVWIMAKSYSTTVKTDIRGNASEGTLTSLKVLCTKLKKTPEISIEIRNVKLKKFEIIRNINWLVIINSMKDKQNVGYQMKNLAIQDENYVSKFWISNHLQNTQRDLDSWTAVYKTSG